MSRKRRVFSAAFKSKVALAAVRGERTTAQLASQFAVHSSQVTAWKKHLLEQVVELFEDGRRQGSREADGKEQELYEQIGRLTMEIDWLKKNLPSSPEEKRSWIERDHPTLSIARQCELLGLSRSTCYYQPAGESAENLALMRRIDVQYLKRPFYGSRKLSDVLQVNRKRVQRLMRRMGIEAVYPRRGTSQPAAGHKIYPYLLRNVAITRPDQVWSTDITYLPLRGGFLYLVAVMDWFSRLVLAWRLSNTLDGLFCREALDEALAGGRPEIFNSDQGAQFTATTFTERLLAHDVAISMDGRGRALDNVFIERLWRSVKYEEVYLKDYQDGVGSGGVAGRLLPLLQPRADPPGARLPHAGRCVPGRLKPLMVRGRKDVYVLPRNTGIATHTPCVKPLLRPRLGLPGAGGPLQHHTTP